MAAGASVKSEKTPISKPRETLPFNWFKPISQPVQTLPFRKK
jgi:hypothetical protein